MFHGPEKSSGFIVRYAGGFALRFSETGFSVVSDKEATVFETVQAAHDKAKAALIAPHDFTVDEATGKDQVGLI